MDGKTLLHKLRQALDEPADSDFLETRTEYNYLNSAAVEFVIRTNCLKSSQIITTVADQTGYTLNADFIKLFLINGDGKLFIKYNDGTNNYFIIVEDYDVIQHQITVTSQSIPNRFAIKDDPTLDTRITGTTTSAGASSGGEATLTDTAADFSDVSAGDIVHNTTDGSDGMVLSKTSSTVLVVALFSGTDDDWTSGDAYVIQPQGRMQIVLDPPPSTAGHTLAVEYVQRPAPVYSDYGVFRFPSQYADPLVSYAAWLYKYKDSKPGEGDRLLQIFERGARLNGNAVNNSLNNKGLVVNLKGRRLWGN